MGKEGCEKPPFILRNTTTASFTGFSTCYRQRGRCLEWQGWGNRIRSWRESGIVQAPLKLLSDESFTTYILVIHWHGFSLWLKDKKVRMCTSAQPQNTLYLCIKLHKNEVAYNVHYKCTLKPPATNLLFLYYQNTPLAEENTEPLVWGLNINAFLSGS